MGISKNSLASSLLDLFPSYFTKMLGNTTSIPFASSDEKISAQSEYIEFLEAALFYFSKGAALGAAGIDCRDGSGAEAALL